MQFGILNIPARKLGGDFYDIIIFNQNKIAIIIADIVGKEFLHAYIWLCLKV